MKNTADKLLALLRENGPVVTVEAVQATGLTIGVIPLERRGLAKYTGRASFNTTATAATLTEDPDV